MNEGLAVVVLVPVLHRVGVVLLDVLPILLLVGVCTCALPRLDVFVRGR